jgi:PKD repeat protein
MPTIAALMKTNAAIMVSRGYPISLAALAACMIFAQMSASGAQAESFSASPRSGPAPLTVKFCASAGVVIDFGDGTRSGMGAAGPGDCPAGLGSLGSYVSHTYTTPGEYRLSALPCPGIHAAACGPPAAQARATVINVSPAQ